MAKKKTAIEYEPSQYQKAIFDYIQHEKGNLVVEAAAGSGKTYTLVKALSLIPQDKRVLMTAFNKDIVKELTKPGRDPREEMPKPVLRTDVLDMKDLKEGMILKGTVRNVIDFGAFVDIGVHQDGLVHISRMTKKFIKHPLEVVSVGDVVEVKVISVDVAKKRIGLSMILE